MSELDPRKQAILRAVVLEYVAHAEPIASDALVQRYEFGVRSATVRNELAEMADLGYLEQPHTSAGRVPSDLGYRYYIDRLVVYQRPDAETKQRLKSVFDETEPLQVLLRETTRALSRLTMLLAAATTFRHAQVTVRSALVTALSADRALLVVVFSNGHVENRMLECPAGLTLDDIGHATEAVSALATGRTLRALTRMRPPEASDRPAFDKLVGLTCTTIRALARELTQGKVIVEGEEFMLAQPEVRRDIDAWDELVQALHESDEMFGTLALPNEGITIGRENRMPELQTYTVVRQRFYVGEDEAGTIALVGPTRMDYDKGVPLLEYAARAVSETLTKLLK